MMWGQQQATASKGGAVREEDTQIGRPNPALVARATAMTDALNRQAAPSSDAAEAWKGSPEGTDGVSLDTLRGFIDGHDKRIHQSLGERMSLARQVAWAKHSTEQGSDAARRVVDFLRPQREVQVLRARLKEAPADQQAVVMSVWRSVMTHSLLAQLADDELAVQIPLCDACGADVCRVNQQLMRHFAGRVCVFPMRPDAMGDGDSGSLRATLGAPDCVDSWHPDWRVWWVLSESPAILLWVCGRSPESDRWVVLDSSGDLAGESSSWRELWQDGDRVLALMDRNQPVPDEARILGTSPETISV